MNLKALELLMKLSIFRVISFAAVVFCLFCSVCLAQSNNETRTQAVADYEASVNKILFDSGIAFREGLLAYVDDDLPAAGEKFNKSLEVFVYSTLNIQKEPKLQGCYNQLIETIFRIESPSEGHAPLIPELAQTCRWAWQGDLKPANKVTAIVQFPFIKNRFDGAKTRLEQLQASRSKSTPPQTDIETKSLNSSLDSAKKNYDGATRVYEDALRLIGPTLPTRLVTTNKPDTLTESLFGFNKPQEFVPSPDELRTIEPNQEEQDINSPVAQQQYQYIQYAVANKSLGFAFQVHPMIQQYINYYRGRGRTTMEVGLYRSGMFMLMARRIFKEESIPENVAWLGQVESAWKPGAMSHMAASGLWQFIPGTGARYGLQRTAYVDERNSFDEATRASARYLKFLYNRYGNWELAIAGYNCGEGNVDRAIRRAGVTNFWAAYPYLPQETRNYVPNILATILIANNPNQYGFGHIRPAAPLRYDRIRIPASTNLSLVAQASDTTVQYLRYLNPHLRSNFTPPVPYIVNVPSGKANDVVALFRRIPATQINNTNLANSLSGETWQNISNRTGVAISDLMAANPGMTVPRGKVFVPVSGNNVRLTSSSRPTNVNASTVAVRVVRAKDGDTVTTLAKRNKVDPVTIAKENGLLPNTKLDKGREIRLPN